MMTPPLPGVTFWTMMTPPLPPPRVAASCSPVSVATRACCLFAVVVSFFMASCSRKRSRLRREPTSVDAQFPSANVVQRSAAPECCTRVPQSAATGPMVYRPFGGNDETIHSHCHAHCDRVRGSTRHCRSGERKGRVWRRPLWHAEPGALVVGRSARLAGLRLSELRDRPPDIARATACLGVADVPGVQGEIGRLPDFSWRPRAPGACRKYSTAWPGTCALCFR